MLPTCSWFAPLAPPWNWFPLKIVTCVFEKMELKGMRMIGTPGSDTLAGMCHALPILGWKFVSVDSATRSTRAPSSRIQRLTTFVPLLVTTIVADPPAALLVHTHAL